MSCTSDIGYREVATNITFLFDNKENGKRCNRCGKTLDLWDVQEDFRIRRHLGYGTKYDGDILDLQICCKCMDKMIEECAITPVLDNT